MSEKLRYLLTGAFGMLLLVLVLAAAPQDSGDHEARFQLHQGEFFHWIIPEGGKLPNEKKTHIGLFMIDTATGNTWRYHQDNVKAARWLPIQPPENP